MLDNQVDLILQVDPAANLTFNLTLSDKEKEDRSRVPLPYMHQSE